jgi:hypothetical protein
MTNGTIFNEPGFHRLNTECFAGVFKPTRSWFISLAKNPCPVGQSEMNSIETFTNIAEHKYYLWKLSKVKPWS